MIGYRTVSRALVYSSIVLGVTGCASVDTESRIDQLNSDISNLVDGSFDMELQPSSAEYVAKVDEILGASVGLQEAQQIQLLNSFELRSLVHSSLSDMAYAAQLGRIANPNFIFERISSPGELELTRVLSFGLLDLITLPKRNKVAESQMEVAQLRMTATVMDQLIQVKAAWVRAVAALELQQYAKKVLDSASAGAELARRMEAVGNFNRLDRSREQTYYADAATKYALSKHEADMAREDLVRLLGLTAVQAHMLTLPNQLPDLPSDLVAVDTVRDAMNQDRIDIQLAKSQLIAAGHAQGLDLITSFTDVEVSYVDKTQFGEDTRTTPDGYELAISLPIFDWGDQRREAMSQQSLAAAFRYEHILRSAATDLRKAYSAYSVSHSIATHYRDEIVPLRKAISEENLLRYNGMIIGVFELLADSRQQIAAVMGAIDSKKQFWMADIGLQAALVGNPRSVTAISASATSVESSKGH